MTQLVPGAVFGPQVVYDNTCLDGVAYYVAACDEEVFDSGRVPGTGSPGPDTGTQDDNWINGLQIGYCAVGIDPVTITVRVYEDAAICGTAPGSEPLACFRLVGLPGDQTGTGSCWIATLADFGLCLRSDGDGVFDGVPELDAFTWSFSHEHPGVSLGPLLAGDPGLGAEGTGTYYNSPAAPCGTGLANADSFTLVNDPVPCSEGGSPTGCCPASRSSRRAVSS